MGDWKDNWFAVGQLDVERLLLEWRWLCPRPMALACLRELEFRLHVKL